MHAGFSDALPPEEWPLQPGMLADYQLSFLDLLLERQALRFGDFTLKSGRKSPYFINTGCFHFGGDLDRLGAAYAALVAERVGDDVDLVFGPAYKGIPLALACARAYEDLVGRPVGWTYDRKEVKDHGDGGSFVGAPLADGAKVVIVDVVMNAGTAIRECMAKLEDLPVTVAGIVIAVDREERGTGTERASAEISTTYGVPVHAIIGIGEAVEVLAEKGALTRDDLARIEAYRSGS